MTRRAGVALGAAALALFGAGYGGAQPRPDAAMAPPAAMAPADAGYALGSGDKVRIIVYNEDALSGEYNVGASGEIAFPLIGTVNALGQTPAQVQETIRSRLASGYIRQPRVSVEVLDYRPFFILGEVLKPGQYPYTNGMTVQQAVATAGGYSYRANTKKVYIKHGTDTREVEVRLKGQPSVPVQPGDTVRVAERFF